MSVNFNNIIALCNQYNIINTQGKYSAGALICPNQYFGIYQQNQVTMSRNSINRTTGSIQNKSTIIVVLAESPHVDEYNFTGNNQVVALGPLMKYDNVIQTKLKNFVGSLSVADVYLFNAIQYQCSFGNTLYGKNNSNKNKNNVFSLTWNTESAMVDLIKNIQSLLVADEKLIVLNACTNALKACCNSYALKSMLNNPMINIIDVPHVSHW